MKMRERIQELRAGHVRDAAVRGGCGDPRKQEQWGVTDGRDADERGPAQRATSWPVDQVTFNSNGDTQIELCIPCGYSGLILQGP